MEKLLDIKVIPHEEQRYATCGDWETKKKSLSISVSDMHNEDYEFLVGIHEAIEAWLCKKNGVSQAEVDIFDERYERARVNYLPAPCGCKPTDTSEPGHDRHAPYRKYHKFAEKIERSLARKLNVNWNDYEETINSL